MLAGWLATNISRECRGRGRGREQQQLYILKDEEICLLSILRGQKDSTRKIVKKIKAVFITRNRG